MGGVYKNRISLLFQPVKSYFASCPIPLTSWPAVELGLGRTNLTIGYYRNIYLTGMYQKWITASIVEFPE